MSLYFSNTWPISYLKRNKKSLAHFHQATHVCIVQGLQETILGVSPWKTYLSLWCFPSFHFEGHICKELWVGSLGANFPLCSSPLNILPKQIQQTSKHPHFLFLFLPLDSFIPHQWLSYTWLLFSSQSTFSKLLSPPKICCLQSCRNLLSSKFLPKWVRIRWCLGQHRGGEKARPE